MAETTRALAARQSVVPLSAQYVIDCVFDVTCDPNINPNEHYQSGCAAPGGYQMDAIQQMVSEQKNGMPSEVDYPFRQSNLCAERMPCQSKPAVTTVTGVNMLTPFLDDVIETALASGPVGVSIWMDCPDFQHFKGGVVYDGLNCVLPDDARPDHAGMCWESPAAAPSARSGRFSFLTHETYRIGMF